MLLPLLLLFTLVPLLELWLLIRLSGVFGLLTTISVVLLTGMVGAALARWQGWQAMHRIRSQMNQGIMPAQALGDGALILVAGVLLITPGVLTDVVGLALLLPPVRLAARKGLQMWVAKHVRMETSFSSAGFPQTDGNSVAESQVVEGRVIDAHVIDTDVE
ncbi:MAG: FxsA family protein [Pirellulales bacterium]|nr:FxsA family protein [Pirellulales bacterium]